MFSCCVSTNKKKSHGKSKLKSKELLIDTDTDDGGLDVQQSVDCVVSAAQQEGVDTTDGDKTNPAHPSQLEKIKCDSEKAEANGIGNGKTEDVVEYDKQCAKTESIEKSPQRHARSSIDKSHAQQHNSDDMRSEDGTDNDSADNKHPEISEEHPKSCLSRRSSSRASIKKKVNYNDDTEVIDLPPTELHSSITDDDDVFSDSVPAQLPRGDMCTPYPKKRGSIPGIMALPDWFIDEREISGIMEPPVTPVGRDELAMKRHRFYSDLMIAAQAAAEHRVRFDPFGPDVTNATSNGCHCDCDATLKPSTAAELERLVGRLERIVDRLERSVSARELEIANKALNSILSPRKSVSSPSPPLPPPPSSQPQSLTIKDYEQDFKEPPLPLPPPLTPSQIFADSTDQLEQRIISLQNSLTAINSRRQSEDEEPFLPTVITHTFAEEPEPVVAMSVAGYEDIIFGPFAQYLTLSAKIGGDVATHADMVKKAFNAQLEYIKLAQSSAQPPQDKQMQLLQPTSEQIAVIQNFREKSRTSPFFNHLSAISESVPALGWVCVSPTPGPHVKEMNDAGQFYTNRVLKDWKEKDTSHVEWARSWIQTLTDLQKYIRQYHTTGLVWSGKSVVSAGGAPPPPPPGCPPPPPVMPMADLSIGAGGDGDERSALFAQINKGEDITKSLKKVTSEMQTHKNPTLRTGPAPFVTPQPFSASPSAPSAPKAVAAKPPVFSRDGKKWLIEYQKSNTGLLVDNAEMNNVVYMFRCEGSTLTVKGKINSIVIDSCKKCCVVFESLVSSVEFVNCQSVQMQVLGKVPTISIDKTDGCQMYLSTDSLEVEIISSKSSEMNVLLPKGNGDYAEQPIPEQFKTTIKNNSLKTTCVESLG